MATKPKYKPLVPPEAPRQVRIASVLGTSRCPVTELSVPDFLSAVLDSRNAGPIKERHVCGKQSISMTTFCLIVLSETTIRRTGMAACALFTCLRVGKVR